MKKFLSFALIIAMMTTILSGCGGSDESTADQSSTDVSEITSEAVSENASEAEKTDLESAAEFLKSMYKDAPAVTAADFTRTNILNVAGVSYSVTWTVEVADNAVSVEKGADGATEDTIKINVEKPEADIEYVLKATIASADSSTTEVVFNYKVPAYKEMSFADYYAAQTGDAVMVKGVVSAIVAKSKGNSNNSIYLQGTDGGYYIYGLEKDPVTELGLEIGMTVMSTGTKDIYNGTHEVKDATIEIVDSNKAEVVAIDVTEAFKKAPALNDPSLVDLQGALVTIKGVEITGISTSNNSYYMFKLGDKETYSRISSSSCPLSADEQKAFIETYNKNITKSATVTGIVSVYDGKFYLTPATTDAFKDFAEIERTDAEKVANEKAALSITTEFAVDNEVTVPVKGATFADVAIAWTSEDSAVTVKNGKLVIKLANEAKTVVVKATLTCGDATEVVEFTLKLGAKGAEEKPEGTAYMFALAQAKLGKNLYFTGEMDGNFLAMTEDASKAVKVYVENVTGGVRLYFMKDGKRTYIDVQEYTAGKAGVRITTEPTCVYVKNAELGIYTTNVAGADYYLGTYNTFSTISASKTTYITGENAANVGVTQFPANLTTSKLPAIEAPEEPDQPEQPDQPAEKLDIVASPKADTAYKFALTQAKLGETLYFTGEMDGFYLATTTDKSAAADVYLESVDGGFKLYVKNGNAKTYINIVERDDAPGKVTIKLEATSNTVYKFDSELKILVTNVCDADYYLGTYNTYKTMSASKTTYITGDKAADIGVSQFPAYIVA